MKKKSLESKKILMFFVVVFMTVAILSLTSFSSDVAYADTYGGKEYSNLWYAENLNIQLAKSVIATWNLDELKKNPIVIACIDTGINASSNGGHEVFDGVLTKDKDGNLLGWNSYTAVNNGATSVMDISDEHDPLPNPEQRFHGTKVAGVMAMLIRELGLQDCIKIYPIKANTPGYDSFKIECVINAIERASSEAVGASVINLSLGIKGSGSGEVWRTSAELQKAIKDAAKKSVIVAAADNHAEDSASNMPYYPAAHEGVLGVMALASNGTSLHSTSNYGGAYDVVAPGEEIYTSTTVVGTKNNYISDFSGTSAASPFVSVAAALLKLRYIQEGKLSVDENGVQTPSGVKFETMLSNLDSARVARGTYSFRTLDIGKVLTQDFSSTKYDYVSPSKITLEGDGIYGSGDFSQVYCQRADKIEPIHFEATLLPLGKTDPEYDGSVEWLVKELKVVDGSIVEEAEEVETFGDKWGEGLEFSFVAPRGGAYKVTSQLTLENAILRKVQLVYVEYLPYFAGNVRVTSKDHASDSVDNAPSTDTIYADQNYAFGLTGVEFVDQTVGIKWYVNGEEVKNKVTGDAYLSDTFYFAPKKAGTYVVTAQYGNRGVISGEYTFTLVVKPTIANPTYISLIVVGGVIVLGGVAFFIARSVIKKKKSSTEKDAE